MNAVVHVKMRFPAQTMVPIGWIAVGDPPELRRFVDMPGRPSHTVRPSRNEMLWKPKAALLGVHDEPVSCGWLRPVDDCVWPNFV